MLPVFSEGRVEIGLINKILLTRIESNVDDLRLCRNVVVYSHGMKHLQIRCYVRADCLLLTGFPDSSVVPLPTEATVDCGHFSSRMPRKLCKHFLQTMNAVAFVAFNGRGIPGSSQSPVGSVQSRILNHDRQHRCFISTNHHRNLRLPRSHLRNADQWRKPRKNFSTRL